LIPAKKICRGGAGDSRQVRCHASLFSGEFVAEIVLRVVVSAWLGLSSLLMGAVCLAQPPDYSESWNRSVKLEAEGRPRDAAEALEPLLDDYPQDFQLQLRLGWLRFQAKQYSEALIRYDAALALFAESVDALLGRGWSRYYLRDVEGARRDFEAVLARQPDSNSAREGLDLLGSPYSVSASVSGIAHGYVAHPTKRAAFGTSVTVPAVAADRYLLGGTYRFTHFLQRRGNGFPGSWSSSSFDQHEAYAHFGVTFPQWGALLQYAFLDNDADVDQIAHVVGGSFRLTTWGSLFVGGNASFYSDFNMLRLGLSYRLPVASWLDLVPSGSWQYAMGGAMDGRQGGHAGLTLAATWSRVRLWTGGKYSFPERYPVYLDEAVVYNSPDEIGGGAWAGVGVDVGRGWSLAGAYEWALLRSEGDSGTVDSAMHVGLLTLAWRGTNR